MFRKLMVTGVTLGTAAGLLASAGLPAHAATGATAYRWGAFGTGGHKFYQKTSPSPVSLPAPIKEIASSNSDNYALLTNGTVWAWGNGSEGELGDGSTADSPNTAVKVKFPSGVKIAYLPVDVMPYDTALAVSTTGRAYGWGYNEQGELCLGNKTSYDKPVKLPLTQVSTLAGAGEHASYDSDGTLYSCGANTDGVLGDGNTKDSTTPVQVSGLTGSSVTTLVASWNNEGAIQANGNYSDWGFNATGQLGNGTTTASDSPVQVTLPAAVTQATLGGSDATNGQTIVMLSTGALYAWGNDKSYQLGDGQTTNEPSPELITPPKGVTYQTLASGGATSYAISTAGAVWAWGSNSNGEVGNGTTKTAKEPVQVLTGVSLLSATAADADAAAKG